VAGTPPRGPIRTGLKQEHHRGAPNRGRNVPKTAKSATTRPKVSRSA